jgi:formylmethanofuran dehydrogenase subunit D
MQHKYNKNLDVISMALGDFLFPHADLKLVIAHSFEADVEAAKDSLSKEFTESAARVRLSLGDLKRLGLKDGGVAVPKEDSPLQLHGISVTVTRSDDEVTSLDMLLESS